jgi:hypothetical protein
MSFDELRGRKDMGDGQCMVLSLEANMSMAPSCIISPYPIRPSAASHTDFSLDYRRLYEMLESTIGFTCLNMPVGSETSLPRVGTIAYCGQIRGYQVSWN